MSNIERKVIYGITVEYGHTLNDYIKKYGDDYEDGDLWDFSKEDFESGAIELDRKRVYWLVKDNDGEERYFETFEEIGESCKKNEEVELDEGTSNFPTRSSFPLYVFYTFDEFLYNMTHDPDYPQEEQFEGERGNGDFYVDWDAFEDAKDKFEQDYWDNNDICVLDEDEQERLESKLDDFNDETNNIANNLYDADNDDDYYALKDIELKIASGYYEAAYIDVDGEEQFNYMSEDVAKEQRGRFNNFLKELSKEFGLTKLGVAWGPASNGETGFKILKDEDESLEEAKEQNFYFDVWYEEDIPEEDKKDNYFEPMEHLDDYPHKEEIIKAKSLKDAEYKLTNNGYVYSFAQTDEFGNRLNESIKNCKKLKEDTIKKGDKWVNKGKEGTHGEFKTKKQADAQRKAMFANGYKENLKEGVEYIDSISIGTRTIGDGPYHDGDGVIYILKDDDKYYAEYAVENENGPIEDPQYLDDVGEHDSLEELKAALKEHNWIKEEITEKKKKLHQRIGVGLDLAKDIAMTNKMLNCTEDFDEFDTDSYYNEDDICIYQFPQSLNSKDFKKAKEYGLEVLGKVNDLGFQPGDPLIKGTYANLKKYCEEYLDYVMHPWYLYKEGDIDLEDTLEPLNASWERAEALGEDKHQDEYGLPREVTIDLNDLYFEDEDELDDVISDYLSDEYGFCHYGFNWEYSDDAGYIDVYDIDWDTSESLTEKKHNGKCPYCGSENTDFVDSDEDSEKHVCHDCGQDFLVHDDGEVTTRNNRPIESLDESKKKISYEDALAKLNSGDWDNERFNDAIMDGEVEMPKEESLNEDTVTNDKSIDAIKDEVNPSDVIPQEEQEALAKGELVEENLDESMKSEVTNWWKDVEDANREMKWGINIDNGDYSDVEAMHAAMFDMLDDLKEKGASELFKKGKEIYNKYAISKYNESIDESCSDKDLVDKLVAFGTCDSEEEAEKRVANMSQEMKDEMCKSLKRQAQDHLLNDSLNESKEELQNALEMEIAWCKSVLNNPKGRQAMDAKANYGKDYIKRVKDDLARYEKRLSELSESLNEIEKIVSKYKGSFYNKDKNRIETGNKDEWEKLAKELNANDDDIYGNEAEGYFIDLKKEESLEEGKTSAQRYNDNLHAIFRTFREQNEKMAKFLLDHGVSQEEVDELKANTGLHGNALHQKLVDLELDDEFFERKQESCKESKEYKAWSIKTDSLKEEITILLKNKDNVWEEFAQVENCPTKDMLKEDVIKTYSSLVSKVLKEHDCKILKEEKLYCVHLKVKDANGKVIKEEDLTPSGTKKEIEELKKHLEEVSPEDSHHNRNFYSIKQL